MFHECFSFIILPIDLFEKAIVPTRSFGIILARHGQISLTVSLVPIPTVFLSV